MTDKELKCEICELFGLDNLFPYEDNDSILESLKQLEGVYNGWQMSYLSYAHALSITIRRRINFEIFGAFETYKDYEMYYDSKTHLVDEKLTENEFKLVKKYYDMVIGSEL